jgi:hypothetical protein
MVNSILAPVVCLVFLLASCNQEESAVSSESRLNTSHTSISTEGVVNPPIGALAKWDYVCALPSEALQPFANDRVPRETIPSSLAATSNAEPCRPEVLELAEQLVETERAQREGGDRATFVALAPWQYWTVSLLGFTCGTYDSFEKAGGARMKLPSILRRCSTVTVLDATP